MFEKLTPIIDELRPRRRPSRVLYAIGGGMMAASVVPAVLLALDGFQWAGAVSWRKPFVFLLSVGILLVTTGWILDRLPDRPRAHGILAWTLGLSSVVEVGLITLQTTRGEASHFNNDTAVDAGIFGLMGAAVGVMSICLVIVLVWAIRRRPADRLVSFGVLSGMAIVTTGLGIGSWLVRLGNALYDQYGSVPDTVINGVAGEPKFPHAIAFHGIQVFILAALALRNTDTTERSRMRSMHAIVWSYTAILVFATIQTIVGAGPFEPTLWNAGLAAAVVIQVVAIVDVARGFLRHPVDAELQIEPPVQTGV